MYELYIDLGRSPTRREQKQPQPEPVKHVWNQHHVTRPIHTHTHSQRGKNTKPSTSKAKGSTRKRSPTPRRRGARSPRRNKGAGAALEVNMPEVPSVSLDPTMAMSGMSGFSGWQ